MHEGNAGVPADNQPTIDPGSGAQRMPYSAPILVALDLRVTQGITGAHNDGAEGIFFTSNGGPA